MARIESVPRFLTLVALVGAVFVVVCPRARSANAGSLFTETWKDHEDCEKVKASGTVFHTCDEVSGGSFDISATLSESTPGATGTLSPSLLTTPSTPFAITLESTSNGSSSAARPKLKSKSSSTSGSGGSVTAGFSFIGSMADFKIKEKNGKVTATHSIKTQKCNAQGKSCKNFTYEDIVLTLTKEGDLEISIKATTGSDANGDTFANSIDAENFDGDGSGTYPDTLFLQVDLGGFNFNDADNGNVTATVEVATTSKNAGSSAVNLSDISSIGTLQP